MLGAKGMMENSESAKWELVPTSYGKEPNGILRTIIKILQGINYWEFKERDLIDWLGVRHDRQEMIEAKKAFNRLRQTLYKFEKKCIDNDGMLNIRVAFEMLFYITKVKHSYYPNKHDNTKYIIRENAEFVKSILESNIEMFGAKE